VCFPIKQIDWMIWFPFLFLYVFENKNFSRVSNYKLSVALVKWFLSIYRVCPQLPSQSGAEFQMLGAFISHFKYSSRNIDRGSCCDLLFIGNLKEIGMKLTAPTKCFAYQIFMQDSFIFFRFSTTRQTTEGKATKCHSVQTTQINCSATGSTSLTIWLG
jgi:hypothetical protein